jgi:hypothetical protein
VAQGGLGLIDPEAQQIALQFRWLPYILTSPNTQSSPLALWIHAAFARLPAPYNSLFYFSRLYINHNQWLHFQSPFILISKLLFLFQIDPISLSWTTTMCLDAPLWSLFQIPPTHWLLKTNKKNKKQNYQSLRGQDVFCSTGLFQPLSLLPTISPDTAIGPTYLKQIQATLGPHPPFDFAPHVALAFTQNDNSHSPPPSHGNQIWTHITDLRPNSKYIRHLHYQHHYPVFFGPSPISSQSWSKFWKLRLSPTARNVWYRLMMNKWPALTRLHHFIPTTVPSPYCPHCPSTYHTTKHLAIQCPSSLAVWQSLWQQYLPEFAFSPDQVWYSLLFLRPSPYPQSITDTQWFQLLGTTLHSIWRSYWAYTFDNIPVRLSTMLSTVYSDLQAVHTPHTSSVAPS